MNKEYKIRKREVVRSPKPEVRSPKPEMHPTACHLDAGEIPHHKEREEKRSGRFNGSPHRGGGSSIPDSSGAIKQPLLKAPFGGLGASPSFPPAYRPGRRKWESRATGRIAPVVRFLTLFGMTASNGLQPVRGVSPLEPVPLHREARGSSGFGMAAFGELRAIHGVTSSHTVNDNPQMAKEWLKIVRGLREIASATVNYTPGRGKTTSGTHQARVSVLTAILAPTPDRVSNPVRGGNMTLATIHGVTPSHTVKNERYLSGNRQLGLPADMFFNN